MVQNSKSRYLRQNKNCHVEKKGPRVLTTLLSSQGFQLCKHNSNGGYSSYGITQRWNATSWHIHLLIKGDDSATLESRRKKRIKKKARNPQKKITNKRRWPYRHVIQKKRKVWKFSQKSKISGHPNSHSIDHSLLNKKENKIHKIQFNS